MTEWKPARNGLLLQTLESALAFFATEGSGRPFRNECHTSRSAGFRGPASGPAGNLIPINAHGSGIAGAQHENTQEEPDGRKNE
jgi:hypothetical protein